MNSSHAKIVFLLFPAVILSLFCFSQVSLITYGTTWKYLDNGTNQGSTWRGTGFNDAAWATGNAELGYGDGDETTVISYGPSSSNKYITTYFRKTISIPDPGVFTNFSLSVEYDDGAIVYVNGNEVARARMTNPISHLTLADNPGIEDMVSIFTLPSSVFSPGTNTIAVEVHQQAVTSSDISFNLQLTGNDPFSAMLVRGPYLNMGRQAAITIRWRTAAATSSKVEAGTVFGTYTLVVTDGANKTEHELQLTGLNPDTKYYYRIGNATIIGAADAGKFFVTLPPAGTTRKLRFAVFGDCGRNENGFQTGSLQAYQNYLTANNIEAADAMLLLGDNAYTNGTDAEFTSQFFNAYGPNILRNHKLYPTPGNHDYDNGTQPASRVLPYYLSFTMPANAEIGGLPSGTEAFYSYDIGDIHFLSLDSYGTESGNTKMYDTTGIQAIWIKNDLIANTKKWVIAYWHHPPYSKGSHDSDTDPELRAVRENFIRILERNGVDMVLCGHSHDYERSYLLKGYYKLNPGDPPLTEANFNTALHTGTTSNGKYDGTPNSCVYTYVSGKYNHGTVYVVSGSAGADGGVQAGYPHNALPNAVDDGGMFYFEVENNRLDAKFIRKDGVIADKFTIMKDVNLIDTINILAGNPVTLSASWPGNHVWSTAATTRSITVTPAAGLTNYTVNDNFGCIMDQFKVYANICSGTVNTWVGEISSSWENPLNWSCGMAPGSTSDVLVGHGSPFKPVINSNVTIKSLTTSGGVNVIVNSTYKLDILGN